MIKPIEELTESDYLLLDYINKSEAISSEQIKSHFQNKKIDSIDLTLSELTACNWSSTGTHITSKGYLIQEIEKTTLPNLVIQTHRKDNYSISDLGRKALCDYHLKSKKEIKLIWLKNAWIPILVSLATNLVVIGTKALLPLIQQWLSSSP